MEFDRITCDPDRLNSQPCVRDMRLTVERVLQAMALYPDRQELRRQFPDLEDEDIEQVLLYAAACVDDEAVRPNVTP